MSQFQTYKEALNTALECLEDAEGHTMAAVINIAMSGPYKELGRLHERDEVFSAVPQMFRDTGDVNIESILKIVYLIHETREKIININAL